MSRATWPCLMGPEPCVCICHAVAAGRRASRKKMGPRPYWTREREARLSEGIEAGQPLASIAKAIGVTVEAVRVRASKLGESTRTGWHTQRDVVRMLGVTTETVERWRQDELLEFVRHTGGRWFRISATDMLTFVRAHAGRVFDPSSVTDPTLRRLAETSAIANRRHAPPHATADLAP